MKKYLLVFSLLVVGVLQAGSDFKVDSHASKVAWLAKKVTGQHSGVIALKAGKMDFDGDTLKGGHFVIDMRSIKVLDVKDAKDNGKLTGHLKSEDFFAAEKFPEATFTVKTATPKEGGVVEVTGPLTIKGISNDITFPLKIEKKGNVVMAKGKVEVDRTRWNVRYGSGKFFEGLGDKLIYDTFEVELDLKAKKS